MLSIFLSMYIVFNFQVYIVFNFQVHCVQCACPRQRNPLLCQPLVRIVLSPLTGLSSNISFFSFIFGMQLALGRQHNIFNGPTLQFPEMLKMCILCSSDKILCIFEKRIPFQSIAPLDLFEEIISCHPGKEKVNGLLLGGGEKKIGLKRRCTDIGPTNKQN